MIEVVNRDALFRIWPQWPQVHWLPPLDIGNRGLKRERLAGTRGCAFKFDVTIYAIGGSVITGELSWNGHPAWQHQTVAEREDVRGRMPPYGGER